VWRSGVATDCESQKGTGRALALDSGIAIAEGVAVGIVTRGFRGRRRDGDVPLPPGQYLTEDFPVLSAGPTPDIGPERWSFTVTAEDGTTRSWSWHDLLALPQEAPTVDIHCVTKWSKLGTTWRGVSFDTLFADIDTAADFALVHSYGGYTTNLPLPDIRDGKAWVVYEYEGEPLHPEHGGPIRMLVPHLYFWKSAKWVNGITLMLHDQQGFWEQLGYNDYGDPWREQRYQGD
jgi:DMSO/TMAO reductase YedYZ molybdopterin-dependent catalytic subunit